MATVASLRGELARIRRRAMQKGAPREWCLLLEEGEEVPAVVEARFREGDKLYIRQYPRGLLAVEGGALGHVVTSGGVLIVWPDGSLTPVKQEAATTRRRRL